MYVVISCFYLLLSRQLNQVGPAAARPASAAANKEAVAAAAALRVKAASKSSLADNRPTKMIQADKLLF